MRRRIASAGTTAVLVVALGVVGLLAVGLVSGRWHVLPVLSASMDPTIPAGSLAVAMRTPLTSIEEGDIILFRTPVGDHHAVVHRVVAVVRGGGSPLVRTKGDANTSVDPWLTQLHGSVTWKVGAVLPYAGYATLVARTSWLGVLLMLGGAVGMAAAGRRVRRVVASGYVAARR